MSVVAVLALAACSRQTSAPVTEQPDPPSMFVGEEDGTTPAPPRGQVASVSVGDSSFEPTTLVVSEGQVVRIENTGTMVRSLILAGVDVGSVGPGESEVVPIELVPGRYVVWLREDPSITGTVVVT
ncbi:MAG: cupredoxin domain-containing protein [Actinomycetota bacterium]